MKLTDATLKAYLTSVIATGKMFDPAATYVGVASALTDHQGATVQADVTEATGAMATRQAVTAWGTPYKLDDGRWVVDGPNCTFAPASSVQGQVLSHWFLNSAATAGTLKAFEAFASPVDLPDETKAVTICPRLTIDPAGNFSASIVFGG